MIMLGIKDVKVFMHLHQKVFARFDFDRRVEALLLAQIYPFENYLAADGKREIKIRNGRGVW
jgi:hypothetical protein